MDGEVRIVFEDVAAYDHAISEAKAAALCDAAHDWQALNRTDGHLLAQWLRARAELHRIRAGVVAEEPEGVVEYRVLDADGEFWAGADRLAEALHYLALEPGGRIERAVWVPVKQEYQTTNHEIRRQER